MDAAHLNLIFLATSAYLQSITGISYTASIFVIWGLILILAGPVISAVLGILTIFEKL